MLKKTPKHERLVIRKYMQTGSEEYGKGEMGKGKMPAGRSHSEKSRGVMMMLAQRPDLELLLK